MFKDLVFCRFLVFWGFRFLGVLLLGLRFAVYLGVGGFWLFDFCWRCLPAWFFAVLGCVVVLCFCLPFVVLFVLRWWLAAFVCLRLVFLFWV